MTWQNKVMPQSGEQVMIQIGGRERVAVYQYVELKSSSHSYRWHVDGRMYESTGKIYWRKLTVSEVFAMKAGLTV